MKEIHVEDMHCIHCQEKIEKAMKLQRVAGTIDLEKRIVSVEDGDVDKAASAIRKAGYTPAL